MVTAVGQACSLTELLINYYGDNQTLSGKFRGKGLGAKFKGQGIRSKRFYWRIANSQMKHSFIIPLGIRVFV